jgi:glutathione S-transferase
MTGAAVTLIGAAYSVYVRAARMALESKGVAYTLDPLDIFSTTENTEAYRRLHPFGRIPVLRHGDFTLYETAAINRYVDEAFDGPPLQPTDVGRRARMMQIMSMADSYGYRALVWDIYVERVSNPKDGKPADEALIASAIPKARTYLGALEELIGDFDFLADTEPTLADFHTLPVIDYFVQAPEGEKMLGDFPRIAAWWQRASSLPAWHRALAA